MAHTYVVTSAMTVGDQTTVTGTVDGTPVTVNVWKSALTAFPSVLAMQAYLAPLMLAALPPAPVVQPNAQVGTWSQ